MVLVGVMLHPMDGRAKQAADAPVPFGAEGAEAPVGGPQASAPVPSSGLAARHKAAMSIVETMGRDERWALLEAVVWPEAAELREDTA